jgi:natural product biosynthesis luciferase-like monooxygenase protein
MLDPILAEYREVLTKVKLHPPSIEFVSGVSGTWIRPEEATDPDYWVRELRDAVRFSDGVSELAEKGDRLFLEVGPGNATAALVRGHADVTGNQPVLSSCRHAQSDRSDVQCLLNTLGKLWLAGVSIEWSGVYAGEQRHRVPLPTYPFERQRYWIDSSRRTPDDRPRSRESGEELKNVTTEKIARIDWDAALPCRQDDPDRARPFLSASYVAPTNYLERAIAGFCQQLLGINEVGIYDNFFELGGNSLIAVQLMSRVREALQVDVPLIAFLRTPTVSELAVAIAQIQSSRADHLEIARILEEVEGLTPEEIRAQLPAGQRCEVLVETTTPCDSHSVISSDARRHLSGAPASTRNLRREQQGEMQFSLFFFSGDDSAFERNKYELVIEGARFADRHGFSAVWTPERHFHNFGGLYPNPSVLGSALAMVTERIQIRAGSVVVPLHHPIRVAEEWAVVDNLSGGRVGLGFAAGFHPNDFVFSPDSFAGRRETMLRGIRTIQKLWQGGSVSVQGGSGKEIEVQLHPKPVQSKLPTWLATGGNPHTYVEAGEIGANVLTALLFMSVEELAERIALYRDTLARHGHDARAGRVTLMLHTFIGDDIDEVRETVRGPFYNYLRSHFELIKPMAEHQNIRLDRDNLSAADEEALLSFAFERYFNSSSLCGTKSTCLEMVDRLREAGVDEIASLIDFGVSIDSAMGSLHQLNLLKEHVAARRDGSSLSV